MYLAVKIVPDVHKLTLQHLDAVFPGHGTVQLHVPGVERPPRAGGSHLAHCLHVNVVPLCVAEQRFAAPSRGRRIWRWTSRRISERPQVKYGRITLIMLSSCCFVKVLKSERLRDNTGSLDPAYQRFWHHCPWQDSILCGPIAIFAFFSVQYVQLLNGASRSRPPSPWTGVRGAIRSVSVGRVSERYSMHGSRPTDTLGRSVLVSKNQLPGQVSRSQLWCFFFWLTWLVLFGMKLFDAVMNSTQLPRYSASVTLAVPCPLVIVYLIPLCS